MEKFTLKDLEKLDPCVEGLFWYRKNIKSENIREILLQLNTHRSEWARWLFPKLIDQKQAVKIAVFSAEVVLPLFEKEYPNDMRVRDCIQAVKDYSDGKIDIATLQKKRAAANAAYATHAAAASSAYATNAASSAYATNAAVAAAAVDAVDAATNAATNARKETQEKILNYVANLLEGDK